jgi:hypothetical protein
MFLLEEKDNGCKCCLLNAMKGEKNSHNFSSKDNVDVGPRPRDLRVGKESKNKELEKRLD